MVRQWFWPVDGSRTSEVAAEIETAGGETHVFPPDLGDLEPVRRLLDEVGDVDILVNGAGIFPFADTASRPSKISTHCSPSTSVDPTL